MVLKNLVTISSIECPHCGSHYLRRTNRKEGLVDRILSWMNIYPYRCCQRQCKKRFYRFGRG